MISDFDSPSAGDDPVTTRQLAQYAAIDALTARAGMEALLEVVAILRAKVDGTALEDEVLNLTSLLADRRRRLVEEVRQMAPALAQILEIPPAPSS